MITEPDLLMVKEAGLEFNPKLSAQRIRQLCDAGELRAFRTTSGVRLIPRSEIERLIDERARRAAARHSAV
jgi:hypothetical protein